MQLNINEAMDYIGIKSKNTFLKRKMPFTKIGRQKLYEIDHIEKAFSDKKDMPRILPSKPEQNIKVEVSEGADIVALEFKVTDHQQAFGNMLDKVKSIKGDKYQAEIVADLLESLIKSAIVEEYHFGQMQILPDNKDVFSMWKQSISLKMDILKKLGL